MKGLILAVVIVTAGLSASAQGGGKKDRLVTLELTTQQKASVDSIRKIYDGKRASLKNDASIAADARTEKQKDIRKEQTAAINSVLTEEQRQQLKKETKKKAKKEN